VVFGYEPRRTASRISKILKDPLAVSHRPFLLSVVLCLSACSASKEFQLYPLEGPLAAIDPPLKISAKAEGADVGSGRLSFKLPEKIKCDGTWTAVVPKVVSESSGLSLTLKGPGANVDNKSESVPGVNSGEIYAVCTDGRRVQGNFVMGSGTTSGTGSATDTKGNVYKVLF
jgi:hypothetical protein